jgi:hypothetical protein
MRRPMPFAVLGAATNERELQAAIDATTHISRHQLQTGGIPPLYLSGVVYERETRAAPPVGVERFQSARDAYLLGHSDCDGLAPWRAAELQVAGESARAVVVPSSAGYHVIVRRGDGSTEDPSARLGMLDGFGLVGDDATPTAKARRRRFMAALAARGERLLEAAARTQGAPRRALLAQVAATGRALQGMERQAAADGQPPVTDEEVEAAREAQAEGVSVSGRRTRRAARKALAARDREDEFAALQDERDELQRQLSELEAAIR